MASRKPALQLLWLSQNHGHRFRTDRRHFGVRLRRQDANRSLVVSPSLTFRTEVHQGTQRAREESKRTRFIERKPHVAAVRLAELAEGIE
jgi:hypothetical protein